MVVAEKLIAEHRGSGLSTSEVGQRDHPECLRRVKKALSMSPLIYETVMLKA